MSFGIVVCSCLVLQYPFSESTVMIHPPVIHLLYVVYCMPTFSWSSLSSVEGRKPAHSGEEVNSGVSHYWSVGGVVGV